jgi:hypothetical protein
MAAFDSVRFNSGRPLLSEVTADRLNAILREIRKNRPRGERGITVRESGDATYIGLATAIKQGGAIAQRNPWDIYVESSEEDTYTLKVQPATITGILPDNWDDEFEANKNDLHYGIATITTDGRAITGVTISIGTTAPAQQSPEKFAVEQSVELLFGLFFEGQSYNILKESVFLSPRLRLVTSAEAASPGQSPFDLWYELA